MTASNTGATAAEPSRLAYRPREAAALLGCSHQFVYQLIRKGQLRAVRIGRAQLIPAGELDRLLAGGADAVA